MLANCHFAYLPHLMLHRNGHRLPMVIEKLADYMSASFIPDDELISSEARFYWKMLLDADSLGDGSSDPASTVHTLPSPPPNDLSPSTITTLSIRYSSPFATQIWEPFISGPNNVYLQLQCLGGDRRWEEWFMRGVEMYGGNEWKRRQMLCARLVEYLNRYKLLKYRSCSLG